MGAESKTKLQLVNMMKPSLSQERQAVDISYMMSLEFV